MIRMTRLLNISSKISLSLLTNQSKVWSAAFFTVPNTITRLSKKLGYDGFSHLKNSIKDEINTSNVVNEEGSYYLIQKTFELLDMEQIEKISKLIHDAKHVLFFGVGDSADFCEMMVRNLRVAGKGAEFSIHRHEVLHRIEEMNKKDVLFLISLSGETEQVLEMAEQAKPRGITIVSLTHFSRNSLEKLASFNLYCYSPKKVMNGYNITDKTPLMVVLQAISQLYWDHF